MGRGGDGGWVEWCLTSAWSETSCELLSFKIVARCTPEHFDLDFTWKNLTDLIMNS